MIEHVVAHALVAAGYFIEVHRLYGIAEAHAHSCEQLCPGEARENTVGGRQHCGFPASVRQRNWQIANDIADAANLTARQRPVLSGQKQNALCGDLGCPDLANEVELLTQHVWSH